MGTITTTDATEIFFKAWGSPGAGGLFPRLGVQRRYVGYPDAVPPGEGLPRDCT
jgi:hypothetical protein